jgi:hypothetical protein
MEYMMVWEPREYTIIAHATISPWERGRVDARDASGPVAPPGHEFDTWWTGLEQQAGILSVYRQGYVVQYYGHPRSYVTHDAWRTEQYRGRLYRTSLQALQEATVPSYIVASQLTPGIAAHRLGDGAWFGVVPRYCLWYAARMTHEDRFGMWVARWYEVYLQPNIPKLRTRRLYAPVLLHRDWPALALHGKMHLLGTNAPDVSYQNMRTRTYELWRQLANMRYPLVPEQIMKTPVVSYTTLQNKKELRVRLQQTAAAWIGSTLSHAMKRYPVTTMGVLTDDDEATTLHDLLHALHSTQPPETSALTGLIRTARWFAIGYGLTNERSAHVQEAKRWFVDVYSDGVYARTYWYTLGASMSANKHTH